MAPSGPMRFASRSGPRRSRRRPTRTTIRPGPPAVPPPSARLAPRCRLHVDEGEGPTHLDVGGDGLDGRLRLAVGVGHGGHAGPDQSHPVESWVVTADARGTGPRLLVQAPLPAAHGQDTGAVQHGHEIGFVECADPRQQVAQALRGRSGELGEPGGSVHPRPPAAPGHPPGQGEMVVGDDRGHTPFETGLDHAAVVVQGCPRDVAGLGLDAGPLQREAVRVETEFRQQSDVLAVAVVVVAGVARRLHEGGMLGPLEGPDVGVDIAPFDLVTGSRRSPEEAVGKRGHQASPVGMVAKVCRTPPDGQRGRTGSAARGARGRPEQIVRR